MLKITVCWCNVCIYSNISTISHQRTGGKETKLEKTEGWCAHFVRVEQEHTVCPICSMNHMEALFTGLF